ncbi:MAG: sensor histidine kinase [Planctomycetota bacterium]|jgi:PAS domain S-box-containing protein
MRARLVWKLSAVVVAILTVAIALSGYVNNLICAHYSLESGKAFLRFNSESIIQGIGRLMMSRDNEGIKKLIVDISQDSAVYGDIRLVSHYSGEVVASRLGAEGRRLELEDWACAACHDQDDLGGDPAIVDAVIDSPEGNRILSVVAPILNESGCRSAACHAHTAGPPVLGFLVTGYSLDRMDEMATARRVLIVVTVLVSLLLGIVAMWLMFTRLLARPINGLIAGTKRIAANQFDFRFDQHRDDEIGVLEESFNTMMATIQADREELRGAKEYLEGIVENSADIIISVTPGGLIETFNRGAEQALGYARDEVIGQRIEILFADPRERDVAIARLNGTDNVRNYETRFLAKDGQARNVLLTLSRLRDGNGKPIGTFGISKDITQEKKLQRELVQSQKFAAIGQAVTGIQHAIKNMLGSLTGGAYLLRIGAAKDNRERVEKGSAMVEEGIERIKNLSHNMLNYAQEWKPELQRVDLSELAAKVCEQNGQTAADQGVALRCEMPDGLPAVLCDPRMIHMAATDLLVNALDACTGKVYRGGESPEVVLESSSEENSGFFVIEVRDNGSGMNEDIRRSIFTPFFSTKKNRGTGLGLALTARFINLHDGRISVESEPEQGTTIRFHLPIDGPRETREAVDGQAGSHN